MKLLTPWQTWWDDGRKENKFHCDLLLEPGDFITIISSDVLQSPFKQRGKVETIAPPPGKYTKVHLVASWEHRETLFAEDEDA